MSDITYIILSILNEDEKNILYNMYANTYESAGQPLWFKNPRELFNNRYKCLICKNFDYTTAYLLLQFKTNFNKISLICHDGTQKGKQILFELLEDLLKNPGTIMEASDAVSWVLRKKECPMILEKTDIENALDIVNSKHDKIKMNESFAINNKNTQSYTRIFTDNENNTYYSDETLFGSIGCVFNSNNCNRTCIQNSVGSGKKKRNNKKSKRRKTKNL
jgi:hypothetical protein